MIGVFDSGFGGLTILKELQKSLPEYDFVYLGDNARAPYGARSFDTIYSYTLQAVQALFDLGCPLVILACNTVSAKALRTIQQNDLPKIAPQNRVLGIVRPTAECIGEFSESGHVGIFATPGTVSSESYLMEISHFSPNLVVSQQACPFWVPLVENGELDSPGAEFFIKRDIDALFAKDPAIDTVLLACTHYPLLSPVIQKFLPKGVRLISQGEIVANKTVDYLKRHPEIENRLQKTGKTDFWTTDTVEFFEKGAFLFGKKNISAKKLTFSY
ncbi:MAG: glutamate racemase [Fibrobacteraceae bacterium]|nr:glutamate racemase [Fibrobacteraceae bacterium]